MQTIPLTAVPNQTLTTIVNEIYLTINLRTLDTGLYFDLLINNVVICQSVLCLHGGLLVRGTYQGYAGDFMFVDTQGNEDPVYTGFPDRFLLVAV